MSRVAKTSSENRFRHISYAKVLHRRFKDLACLVVLTKGNVMTTALLMIADFVSIAIWVAGQPKLVANRTQLITLDHPVTNETRLQFVS